MLLHKQPTPEIALCFSSVGFLSFGCHVETGLIPDTCDVKNILVPMFSKVKVKEHHF